jgi:hypothetical protein
MKGQIKKYMSENLESKQTYQIPMEKLIYWIDKKFVQWRANELIGRDLNSDEIERTTEFIEWGLSSSVFEVIDISINETVQEIENG